MFFRPETSLVPSVLSLSGFFTENFPHISWYPYWYLGNPFSYLIGPVVPSILALISMLLRLPRSFVGIEYLMLIFVSMVMGGVGVYLLVREWEVENFKFSIVGVVAGTLYVLLPFSWLGLYYQNGLKMVAFSVVPFVFIVYRRFLLKIQNAKVKSQSIRPIRQAQGRQAQDKNHKLKPKTLFIYYFFLVLLITFCLLITVNVLLTLIIGVAGVFIGVDRFIKLEDLNDRGVWAWREEKIVKTIIIFFLAISLATFWYTPRFWFVILTNPSFGGVTLWNLIVNLFQSLLNFLPLVLAILVVKWRFRRQSLFFAFIFFISFLFLTGARFVADPDFVIDWIGFVPELQFGAAILLSAIFIKLYTFRYLRFLECLIVILFAGISGVILYNLFFYSKSDYQKDIIDILESQVKDKDARVFLSGSDVFWINYFLPLQQVRGVNDGASIHPYWVHGAYQIREGEKASLTENWLKILGSSYLLLHQPDSNDPFHDFKHPEKFKHLQLVAEKNGDKLYKIPRVSIARVVDKGILNIGKPKSGADGEMLGRYAGTFKRPITLRYQFADNILIKSNISSLELINLAVSFGSGWRLKSGAGKLVGDSLGNIVIIPTRFGEQEFVLAYERGIEDWLIPTVLFVLGGGFLLKFEYIYLYIRRRIPRIHLGIGKEEDY